MIAIITFQRLNRAGITVFRHIRKRNGLKKERKNEK